MSELPASRTILHADLDAFYAAVEVRENPALRGREVVVGADPRNGRGRGVVSTASYEARRFGVRSAMPISTAYRLCPHAVYLPPRFEVYERDSRRFFEILERFTDLVEPLSIDEAFLDVTGSRRLFGNGESIARRIQDAVRSELGLTVSVGIAPVKFAAKIASDLDKPEGCVLVTAERLHEFLDPLPVQRLFGAGPRARERFRALGLATLGDVRRATPALLAGAFGRGLAEHFQELARGVDARAVVPDRERKSLGKELTFAEDVLDRGEVRRTLLRLLEEAVQRLRRAGLCGRTVVVKLRTADFRTVTRSATQGDSLDTVEAIWPVARRLLEDADRTPRAIRLVGVALSHLHRRQPGLFDGQSTDRKVSAALDAVARRFGVRSVFRGAQMKPPPRG